MARHTCQPIKSETLTKTYPADPGGYEAQQDCQTLLQTRDNPPRVTAVAYHPLEVFLANILDCGSEYYTN